MADEQKSEDQIDESLAETFPASDPPSYMPPPETEREIAEKRRDIARREARWLKEKESIDERQNHERGAIPSSQRDPAAAPLGTDQEAGGPVSTPDGRVRGR
ncbi:MAG: hypothetical protein EOM26_09165 [Alphaproteobacteria bacterium]|nr:hypothetical protein [Alphaproteobacteria bacterium]